MMFMEFKRDHPFEVECCQSAADFLRKRGFPRGTGAFKVDYPLKEPTPVHHWNYLVSVSYKIYAPDNLYHNKAPILDFTAFQYNGHIDVVLSNSPVIIMVGSSVYQRYEAINNHKI